MMRNKLVAGIKSNGKVMREINENIYLPFNSNYSIFLKNLSSKRVQVNIKIDGEDILDGNSLIIDSNCSMDLNRWLVGGLQSGPKLKFVEKTDEIRETREETEMDGIVKITYQFESKTNFHWNDYVFSKPIPDWYQNPSCEQVYYGSSSVSCPPPYETICSSNVESISHNSKCFINKDGMTVKGEDTNQQFVESYIGYLDPEIHTICFTLKGGVPKPITVKTKIKCPKCNFKNKSSYRFCTQCGNNLKYN